MVARLCYRQGLVTTITPLKETALRELPKDVRDECMKAMGAQSNTLSMCSKFCSTARDLSGMRRRELVRVRKEFPVSAWLAATFDRARSVKQDSRVEDLFMKKTCGQLVDGVDRTNMLVDYFCACLMVIAFLLAYKFMPLAEDLHKRHAGARAMLSTLLMLFPIVMSPQGAVLGAVMAAFLPQYLVKLITPYAQIRAMLGTVPLLAQLGAVTCIGVLFLVASSNTSFVALLVGRGIPKLLGLFAIMESAILVLAKAEGQPASSKTD